MQYVKLESIHRKASRLVLGTMALFSGEEKDGFDYLDMAAELGCNVIDSAAAYGNSELTLGKWMKNRNNRDDIVLISKGAHPNFYRKRVTPFDITADLHDSLARLQVDFIDIYFLHRDDVDVPVESIVDILNEHYETGKIKSFGGSNWTHTRLEEANNYAAKNGLKGFEFSSPQFSLAEQRGDPWAPGAVSISGSDGEEARRWYANNEMPVFAYSSMARGFFSGRVTKEIYESQKGDFLDESVLFSGKASKDQLTGHGEKIDPILAKAYCTDNNFKRLDRVAQLAKEKDCMIPQIALAYIVNGEMNVLPICGVANKEELQSSIDALDIKLTKAEMDWLDLRADVK